MKRLLLPIPPLSEQRTIAAYLDRKTAQIDTLIAKKQRLIDLLQEQRTAVINRAVTQGLDPDAPMQDSGIEWLGEVPAHWEMVRLKYLINGGLEYGANESANEENPEHPRYIRITDFDDAGALRDETFKSLPPDIADEYLLEDGDILFARSGATVGKTFQFKGYHGDACYAGYLIKASPNEKEILSDFLYLFTKSKAYENWKNSIFIQATIQNIGANKYQELEIPVPPLEEQREIVNGLSEELSEIDKVIAREQLLIEKLQELRTSLISEVVTGKIDVRDEVPAQAEVAA
jgi:restriction endonuclease S subunit